ncbi:acyltransferase family protein [Solidesulfovibrio alcoholivorans]|uniref:acyltransferase family protein n=1 Tax=Solidesulfovibrio alcoholivorans TaxID=81406 RepID=UPI000497B956|nr:acyltransferase [Solidesulfovibrio alcoholivorans]
MEKGRGKPPFLAGLGGFRALAALAVLAGHALAWLTPLPRHPFLAIPAARLTQAGLSGFFVLSGFVLFYTHAPRPDAPAFSAKRFALARLARIYPVYLLLLLAHLGLAVLREPGFFTRFPGEVLAHATLVQTWFFAPEAPSLFPIGWAVSTEVFFYLLFPLLLRPVSALATRRAALVTATCALGTAVCADAWIAASWPALFARVAAAHPVFADHATDLAGLFFQWLTYTAPYLRLPEFLCGMATARLFLLGARPPAWLGPAAGAGLCLLAFTPFPHGSFFLSVLANNALYAPCLAAVCLGLAARAPAWAGARPVRAFAGASLSVYLLQPLTLEPWQALLRLLPDTWPAVCGIGMAATVVTGLLLSRFVEAPAARRILGRHRPKP